MESTIYLALGLTIFALFAGLTHALSKLDHE